MFDYFCQSNVQWEKCAEQFEKEAKEVESLSPFSSRIIEIKKKCTKESSVELLNSETHYTLCSSWNLH